MRGAKKAAFFLIPIATAFMMAGCSQNPMTTTTSNGSSPTTSGGGTQGRALEMIAQQTGNYQSNFNPFSASANQGTLGLVYQCLVYFDPMTGKQFPLLGQSYQWSNGNKTLTVQLRQGATWSDGTAFTSDDVVFTYNLLKKYPAADTNGVWTQLASVTASGPNAVVFNFKTVNVPFAQYVLGDPIVPAHIWSSLGDPTKAVISKPIGTGPYTLGSFSPQDIKWTAYPKYWGGEYTVKTVDEPAYNGNDAATMALTKGEVDWTGLFIPSIQNVFVKRDPQHNHYWFPPSNSVMLYLNLKNPSLSDLAVRQAISAAINRGPLASEGEYGYTVPASTVALTLPLQQSWLDPSIPQSKLQASYNPQQAISILQNDGYTKNAQGIMEKNGKQLSFTLQVVAGWTDWDTDCSLIAADLKKVGIDVKVEEDQFGAYSANLSGAKKSYDMAVSWTNAGATPYTLYENLLNSKGNYNVEQLSDPTIDAALHNYSQTTDVNQQKKYLYTVENYMINDLPALPLFYGPVWYEYSDKNFTGFPTEQDPYISPSPYDAYAQAIVIQHLKPVS